MNTVNRIVSWAVVGLGLALTCIIFIEVVSRYLFNSSIIYIEELSRILLIWFSYLGAGLALHEGGHVGFDFVRTRLRGTRAAKLVLAGNLAIMALFVLAVFVASLEMLPMLQEQMTATLGVSMLVPYCSLTAGSAYMLLRIGYSLVCLARGREERLLSLAELLGGRAMQ